MEDHKSILHLNLWITLIIREWKSIWWERKDKHQEKMTTIHMKNKIKLRKIQKYITELWKINRNSFVLSHRIKMMLNLKKMVEMFYFKIIRKMVNLYMWMKIICLNITKKMKLCFLMSTLILFHNRLYFILNHHHTS